MLPKEHGAYGQLTFPLLAAFGVAGFSASGLLIAASVVAGFLAHEPAAILLNQRGPRAKRERGPRARRWLAWSLACAVTAAAAAFVSMEPGVRWSLAIPIVPAILLAIVSARGREKTWYGETIAAVSFAGAAVPIAMAAGVPFSSAAAIAIPFALLFIVSTLAVRVVILRVRGGGDPRATAMTRAAALSIAAGGGLALAALSGIDVLSEAALISAAPGLILATVIAVRPPAPTHLRRVGWSLVGVSVLTSAMIIATV